MGDMFKPCPSNRIDQRTAKVDGRCGGLPVGHGPTVVHSSLANYLLLI